MHVLEAAAFANLIVRKATRAEVAERLFAEPRPNRFRLGAPLRAAIAFAAVAAVVVMLNAASAETAAQVAATATAISGS